MFKKTAISVLILLFPLTAQSEPIKLGIVLPLTGDAAAAGEAVRNGASMANADSDQAFNLIFEDSALDSSRAASAVKKLIEVDKVEGLIVFASGPSNVAAPMAEHAKVPMIGLAVDPLVSKQRRWVMIHSVPNRAVAEMLVAEAARRDLKKVALVTSKAQGVIDFEGVVQRNCIAKGMQVSSQVQVPTTESNFSALISRLKREAPDAVFLNLYFGQVGNFARQAAALDFKPHYFGQFVLDDDAEIAAAQGALEGAFFVATSAGDLSFDEDYTEKYGKRPVIGGIGAYDAVALFAEAFEAGKGREEANKYLHTIQNFSGKIGRYRALLDNSFEVPAGIGEIHDSKVVKIAQ